MTLTMKVKVSTCENTDSQPKNDIVRLVYSKDE